MAVALLLTLLRTDPLAAAEPSAPPANASDTPLFLPTPALDLANLESLLAARSAASERAKLGVEQAEAAALGARLLPNPVLDGTWGTIPLGTTNPPGLADPLGNIPHYDVGVSYTVQLGKRGPQKNRANAGVRAAEADREGVARAQAIELAGLLGHMATVQLRLAGLAALAAQGAEAITLADARVQAKFGVPLEVDRLRIEVDRTSQQISRARAELGGLLGECTALIVERCAPFASSDEAKEFLKRWTERALRAQGNVAERPDLQSLAAREVASEARLAYAKALAIPDPTVRLGYTHDRFLVSGNQMNSLSVTLSMPLPLFDRGQAERRAAIAERERLAQEIIRRKKGSTEAVEMFRAQIETHLEQQQMLERDLIPRAEEVLRSLQRAAESGLVPLTDTLQARRTLGELLVEASENYGSSFEAALALAAELPTRAVSRP